MKIRRIAEVIDNFKCCRLLSCDSVRINGIHDREIADRAQFANDSQRIIEIAVNRDDFPPLGKTCSNFPVAIFPAGKITAHEIPARAAYAAAEAEVFPVEAQISAVIPRSIALDTATVIPRSLNEPVGLTPSFLMKTSQA